LTGGLVGAVGIVEGIVRARGRFLEYSSAAIAAAIEDEGVERGEDTTGRNISCDEGGALSSLLYS
jgi:hypothetical protein